MTRDKAKEEIIRLVERFRENLDVYKKGTYNETQLRREFVDPFFEALGWDVTNKSGHAEQYKDVVHEDAVKIGVTTKAPDYSFRVGGQRKFFLETKKPAINIKDDVSPAYQIRRYAWNANLRISILTDFEELAVYDCGIKPNPNDKVSMGRVAFYHFEDYVKKFDEIYDTFSKEAVWKGAFDRYAGEGKKGKKGTETVDKEFLKEIERWRELLAKNIAVNNSNLDVYALNFSVQQTIDRIVFLRICEDRGMENYGQLQTLLNGASVYKRLFDVFYKADQKYNSGLFDFSEDKLTHSLSIDDKVLKDIIENLYYPKSPYEFAVFDAEILGNVYEQFLGKVIRLTPSHQAKVEEKPEVKKAGGVYYTPKYIVDYIVANTVGKLLGDISGGSESPFPLEGSVSGHTGGGEGGISPSPLEGEGRGEGLNSYNPRFIQLARNLRKNQTDAEKLMWLLVRNNQLGAKFRRQQPIGKYIADFYCSEKKLAIELDGGKHTESEDRPKTEFLNQAGITVLRFWNSEVLENTEGVLQAIWDKINTPHLNPLPQGERKIFKMTPKQVEKIKILDPACGSGSFLLGAYRFLLDWHLKWYTENNPIEHAKGKRPAIYKAGQDSWRLTTAEKKKILLNNIYGVDIDRQAVEVTKLSLLLKVLEGENKETLGKSLALFRERALPNLESNVKCGNSLIGPDFYSQMTLGLPDEEARRINVFDWNDDEKGFGGIMKDGGFDCVIGNPPYVLFQSLGLKIVEEYLSSNYSSATYKIDTYQIFIERACRIVSEQGIVGFITPNTFLRNKYAKALRKFLLENAEIIEICLFDYGVFEKASVDTAIMILRHTNNPNLNNVVIIKKALSIGNFERFGEIAPIKWIKRDDMNFDLSVGKEGEDITKKIMACSIQLGNFATAYFGIQTHGREQYVKKIASGYKKYGVIAPAGTPDYPSATNARKKYAFIGRAGDNKVNAGTVDGYYIWKPTLDGTNINRYQLTEPVELVCTKPEAIKSGGDLKVYEQLRIGVRQIGRRPIATLLPAGWFSLNTIYNIYFTQNVEYKLQYVLGLISSNLIGWYWEQLYFDQKKTFPKIKKAPLLSIPIRTINFKDKNDKSLHDKMVALVDNMLELNKKLPNAKTPHERELLERQIKITDNHIDRLAYELYGLTEEEIKVVEGK